MTAEVHVATPCRDRGERLNRQRLEECDMRFGRMRLWAAGLVAFLMGFPFSGKAFGATSDIIDSSIGLGLSIADSAGDS